MPQPTVVDGQLTLTFTALQSDIAYTVEASTDLVNWSTDDVTLQSDGNEITASYPLTGNTPAFMHVVVSPAPVVPASGSGEPTLGVIGVNYSYTPPPPSGLGSGITWSLASGSTLPPGLSLNTTTGEITGITNVTGVYTITLQATDQNGNVSTVTITLTFVHHGRGAPIVQIYPITLNLVLPDDTAQTFTIANVGPVGSVMNYTVQNDGYLSLDGSTGAIGGSLNAGESASVSVSIQSQFVNDDYVFENATLLANVYTPGASNYVKIPVSINVYTEQELANNLLGEWSGTWTSTANDNVIDDELGYNQFPLLQSTANNGTWTLDLQSVDVANLTATGTLTWDGTITYWTYYSAYYGFSYTTNIHFVLPFTTFFTYYTQNERQFALDLQNYTTYVPASYVGPIILDSPPGIVENGVYYPAQIESLNMEIFFNALTGGFNPGQLGVANPVISSPFSIGIGTDTGVGGVVGILHTPPNPNSSGNDDTLGDSNLEGVLTSGSHVSAP